MPSSVFISRNLSGTFSCVRNGLQRFGEVAHAPPNLAKIPKLKGLKDKGQAKSWVRGPAGVPRGGAASEVCETANGKSGALRRQRDRAEENAKETQKQQMEEMRQRVQEAYTGLKKKRRAGQTQYVSSEL